MVSKSSFKYCILILSCPRHLDCRSGHTAESVNILEAMLKNLLNKN